MALRVILGMLIQHPTKQLFTSAISTIWLACDLPDLGNKPSLHPSCTKRIRADVSITAFTPITDLVDDPLQEQGGDAHITLVSCCKWAPCSVVSAEPESILPALHRATGHRSTQLPMFAVSRMLILT